MTSFPKKQLLIISIFATIMPSLCAWHGIRITSQDSKPPIPYPGTEPAAPRETSIEIIEARLQPAVEDYLTQGANLQDILTQNLLADTASANNFSANDLIRYKEYLEQQAIDKNTPLNSIMTKDAFDKFNWQW